MAKRESESEKMVERLRKWAEESACAARSAASSAAEVRQLFDDVVSLVELAGSKQSGRVDLLRDDHDETRKMVLALAVRVNKIDPPPPVVMYCPVCRDVELTRGAECNGVVNLTCPKCGWRFTAVPACEAED